MRKNPRRILSPQRLPFRHPGKWQYKSNERIDLLQHWSSDYNAASSSSRASLIVTSMENEIRVLGVFCYVLLYCWANDVDLEVVLSGETESGFCQMGPQAHMAQVFRNFRMVQRQNISGQSVIEIGDFAVAVDFEAAGRDLLRLTGLTMKDFPHGC
jgi:hypothetical protein